MNQKLLDFFVSLSLANLGLLFVWRELLYANVKDRYWIVDLGVNSYLAAFINLFCLTAIIWLGSLMYRRSEKRLIRFFLAISFFISCLLSVNYFRVSVGVNEWAVHYLRDNKLVMVLLVLSLITVFIFIIFKISYLFKTLYFLFLILSPFAIINIAQTSWALAMEILDREVQVLDKTEFVKTVNSSKRTYRTIFLIFDELDQVLTYLDRPDSIDLPAFDKLKNQSVFAVNGKESSGATIKAIPSILSGHILHDVKILNGSNILIQKEKRGNFEKLSDAETIFSEAYREGYTLGIAGFYHPYCRIFLKFFNKCKALGMNTVQVASEQNLYETIVDQLFSVLPIYNRRNGNKALDLLSSEILRLVADKELDLVYGHLSVPHGPNIFDRKTNKITYFNINPKGYFGNLILADRLLGNIRKKMEQIGIWDSSTIVVTSDHGWRHIKLINRKRDYRVPFLVKLPGQKRTVTYEPEFSNVISKDLILRLLGKKMTSPKSVIDFLDSKL
jgi:hypothetical protein